MSSSPFKSPSQLSPQPKNTPLKLSQALLITAGLAGLVGLSSGIIIRFSLSHSSSSNARLLSPLQTFPALPNWTPELPEGGTAVPSLSPSLPDSPDTRRTNDAETNGAETNGAETNDAQANGTQIQSTRRNDAQANSAEANGAQIQGAGTQSDRSYTEPESLPTTPPNPVVEQNQNSDLSPKPSSSAEDSVHPEASHPENSSPDAPSAEDKYPQNYPTVEAPASGETPYY